MTGSTPVRPTILGVGRLVVESGGDVAQLGEHLLCKQKVTGSIPVISTKLVARSTKVKGCMSLSGFERLMELLPSFDGSFFESN